MGTGIQESGMIARATRTGIELVLRTEDLVAAILSSNHSKESDLFLDYVKNNHGTINYDVTIPRDKIEEFMQAMDDTHTPYMLIDPDEGAVSTETDKNGNFISKTPSEYVGVMYRGPIYAYDDDGQLKLDNDGNHIAVPGSSKDAARVNTVAATLNTEYIAEKEIETKEKAYELSTNEANHEFLGKDTVKIKSSGLGELFAIQRCANEYNIKSFMSIEDASKTPKIYQLEFNALDAQRLNNDSMSPVETILVNSKIGLSTEIVQKQLNESNRTESLIADTLMEIKDKETAKGLVIVPLNQAAIDKNDGTLPNRLEIKGQKAFYFDGDTAVKQYNLTNAKEFQELETRIQAWDQRVAYTNDSFNDSIKKGYKNSPIQTELSEIKENTIKYEKCRYAIFHSVETMQKDAAKIADPIERGQRLKETYDMGQLKEDPNYFGYQMMEYRIPESDKIVADTIAKNVDGEIDVDDLKLNMKEHENDLKIDISTPSPYQPTSVCIKKELAYTTDAINTLEAEQIGQDNDAVQITKQMHNELTPEQHIMMDDMAKEEFEKNNGDGICEPTSQEIHDMNFSDENPDPGDYSSDNLPHSEMDEDIWNNISDHDEEFEHSI